MAATRVTAQRLRRVLRDVFGVEALREGQQAVIERVLAGRSTLALMPTGAGKSLCYQLPAVLLPGRTLVISPLIALMKDQCETLQSRGVAAVQLHSGLNASELAQARADCDEGRARVVFTTPEQLLHADFIAALARQPTSLLVVDEAHCLSQWGWDFRPAFLDIGRALQTLGGPTVLALTATATEPVQADIRQQLGIERDGVVSTHLYRPNLHYGVEHFSRAQDKQDRLLALVAASSGSGLVYVATVKAAVDVHAALLREGVQAGLYHGRLPTAQRHAAQDAFMRGELRVMVATNAFGLGIDKPDIRFVVHQQMPAGLDAYFQESGRAGRDGEAADCTLLFVDGDRNVQQFFMAGRYPGIDDFRAVLQALAEAEPAQPTASELKHRLGTGRKLTAALSLLRRQRLLRADRRGRLKRALPADPEAALQALVQACEDKAQRDRAGLAQMVDYAHSGLCRWQLLLAHFEGEPAAQRCGHCDNCRLLAAHEAQQHLRQQLQPSPAAAGVADADRIQASATASSRSSCSS